MEIRINNFKMKVFRALLNQSLNVSDELTFEWSNDQVKSCSVSETNSFIKLWIIQLKDLIESNTDSESIELFEKTEDLTFDFPTFNMYVLKGNLFKRFLSVHNANTVDLLITLTENKGKYQASSFSITSENETSKKVTTKFILSTEDLLTNKMSDYSTIIKECTPSKNMYEFVLSDKQIQEIKRLIKNLHFSNAENTAYLTFTVNADNQTISVNDKVFDIILDVKTEGIKFPTENFTFNILKSDFVVAGNTAFTIYASEDEQKVIFGSNYVKALICCLSTKINESNPMNMDSSILESTIDSLDMDDYI